MKKTYSKDVVTKIANESEDVEGSRAAEDLEILRERIRMHHRDDEFDILFNNDLQSISVITSDALYRIDINSIANFLKG